jgi:hypothetical protein
LCYDLLRFSLRFEICPDCVHLPALQSNRSYCPVHNNLSPPTFHTHTPPAKSHTYILLKRNNSTKHPPFPPVLPQAMSRSGPVCTNTLHLRLFEQNKCSVSPLLFSKVNNTHSVFLLNASVTRDISLTHLFHTPTSGLVLSNKQSTEHHNLPPLTTIQQPQPRPPHTNCSQHMN